MTDQPDATPPPTPPLPPPPPSENSGTGAQSARVLGIAVGGALTMFLATSPQAAVAAAAIIPAFGVIAVWAYGIWERRRTNKQLMKLHDWLNWR